MSSLNTQLHKARRASRDEFYTQRADIEAELRHYRDHFAGKRVYLNCDDPWESEFFRYFARNFNYLKLAALTATSYDNSPIAGGRLPFDDIAGLEGYRGPHRIEITSVTDHDGDGAVGASDVEWLLRNDGNTSAPLDGDGDFRSPECIELPKLADIVVTNPPFSLFREYLAQLVEHDKQFLILGGQNAITYKEVFPLIAEGKVWLGWDNGGTKWFRVPDNYDIKTESRTKTAGGIQYFSMGNICWFTNLDHKKRHEELVLTARYTPEDYPRYDNYDAIEVSRVADIPEDYEGAMGVPITFLDKHNPDQFEILGITKTWFRAATKKYPPQVQVSASGQRSEVTKLNDGAALRIGGPIPKTHYMVDGNHYEQVYARILVRRRTVALCKVPRS